MPPDAAPRWLATRLSLVFALGFGGFGILVPYFPLWLQGRGLDPVAIGAILAISPVVRVIATPRLAALADGRVPAHRMLAACYAVMALACVAVYPVHDVFLIAALVFVYSLAQAPIVPVTDVFALGHARRTPRIRYGSVRLWGSVSFITASLVGGVLVKIYGDAIVVLMLAALAASAVLPAWTAPHVSLAHTAHAATREAVPAARLGGPAVMVIAAYALIQGSHAGLYGFASISWTARGFSEALVGALWAVGLIVEIALFARMAGLGRGLPVAAGLIVVGGTAAVIRWAGMAMEPGPALALFFQCLHGVSYAATHLGAVAALDALAPEGRRARVQGQLAAATAACMAGFTFIAGRLYAISPPLAFAAMLVPAGLGLAFAILVFVRARRSQA